MLEISDCQTTIMFDRTQGVVRVSEVAAAFLRDGNIVVALRSGIEVRVIVDDNQEGDALIASVQSAMGAARD